MRKMIVRPAIAFAMVLSMPVVAHAAMTDDGLTTSTVQRENEGFDWGLLGLLGLAGLMGLKRRDDHQVGNRSGATR